ncbi:class I adenylate-forming enzyme family protein [Nonomuraea soli]|uniref:Acyl-coenzyme A synthetase/AMP-(Fatty) acid ligase n=1 Tax=Nonomuraea soli TaxID=1032476 RepID=A0A7W0CQC8_9ACTN|nr:class I adenylate-forming enzyme family protein [Nonomuraea soli]MBA2895414.1 acyl-coenzyme A synthetase/AMP-(fatty) acid ligase [Nonomuraea soli]
MTTTLPELVRDRDGDHVALTVDGDRSLSVGEWLRESEDLARRLPPGRIALLFDDWIGYAIAELAVRMAGGTVVGLSPKLPARTLRSRLARCEAAGLLHGPEVRPPATGFAGWTATPETLRKGAGTAGGPPDDLAEILFTSGTTGGAKPVAVSLANLTFGHEGRGRLFNGIDGVLAAVPVGTNAGHSAMMTAMTAPATVHVLSGLDPETVARMIEKLRVPMAIVPPSIVTRMVAYGWHERHDLSGLRALMLGSAPVPMATVSRLAQALPETRIVIGYGSTEAAPAFVNRPVDSMEEHLGGPSGGTELMIHGDDGPLPAGRLGEICLRSEAPQRSYFRDPRATARVFRDGWTHMGDLGHVDEEGRLHFFDRAVDVITVDDRTISSTKVQHALHWHPEVVEAAAFGDAKGVCAAVVLRSPVPEKELHRVAAERLESHERPARIVVVDELPRGPIGKIRKGLLRRRLAVR